MSVHHWAEHMSRRIFIQILIIFRVVKQDAEKASRPGTSPASRPGTSPDRPLRHPDRDRPDPRKELRPLEPFPRLKKLKYWDQRYDFKKYFRRKIDNFEELGTMLCFLKYFRRKNGHFEEMGSTL
jgi:hypothetical protein